MKKINRYFIIGIPVIFILGSISHFLYNLTGENFLIGLISPVNESIYEHTKLSIIPLFLFYTIGYLRFKPNKNKWLLSYIISLIISVITIPLLYYFYTKAFGFHSLIIDILIYLVSVIISQLISLHILNRSKNEINYKISLIVLITLFLINIILTINPLKLPLFEDSVSKTYGIFEK